MAETPSLEQVVDSMYTAPGVSGALDLSFMYEGAPPYGVPKSKVQARVNAALIASSVSRSKKDPAEVYAYEYSLLENMLDSDQNNYTTSRITEEGLESLQATLKDYQTAAAAGLLVTGSPQYEQSQQGIILNAGQLIDLYNARDQVQQGYGASRMATGVNVSDSPAAQWMAEYNARNRMMIESLERMGYDIEKFDPIAFAKEFIPGKYTRDTFKYGTGALDMARIQRMSPQDRLNLLEKTLRKAEEAGASQYEIMDIASAFDPDSSKTLVGAFQALDVLDILMLGKTVKGAARYVKNARILSQYKNGAGAAASVGATDVAAKLSAAVLTEKGSAAIGAAVGLDRTTAAMNASPFPFQRLDPSVVGGISQKVQEYIENARKIQHFYITKAINLYSAETTGFLRPGEREAAKANIVSKLPTNAEVVETTPFGLKVRVVTPNAEKFASQEDLALAKRRYELWVDEYAKASDELDRFYEETRGVAFEADPEWVARLERQKDKAKAEMERNERILAKGIEPDAVDEKFIWYQRDKHTGEIVGVLEANPMWEKIISPSGYLRNIDDLLVGERTEILARQERLGVLFQKVVKEAVYGLSNRQMNKVGAVLSYGSDYKKTFTAEELMTGIEVPGSGTVKLSKKETAAYFKYRETMDAAHGMRSLMKYKELGFKGFDRQTILNMPLGIREVDALDEAGQPMATWGQRKVFVKAYGYVKNEDGTTSIRMPAASRIVDATGRGPIEVTNIGGVASDVLRKRLESGKIALVEFESPIRIGDEMLNYGIVSAKKLKELSPDVLPYRTGYTPTIYKAPYVVRVPRKIKFDGRDRKDIFETVRFFGTRGEAEAWARAQTDGLDYIVDSDSGWRSRDPSYSGEVSDAVFTGLYEDVRGQKIPFGPEGKDAPTESAFSAMDRYLDNLAWNYPLNDWREGVLARYFNTVNDYLETPNSLTSEFKATAGLNETQKNAIVTLRNWVQDQLSVVSGNEMAFSRWMKQYGENMENSLLWRGVSKLPGGKAMTEEVKLKMLYGADNADAFGWLRAAAFRTYLGFGNFSQLIVQASNLAVIMSLNPVNAPSVARRFLALRTVAFINPASPEYEKVVRIAAKAALMKYDEFEPMVRAWHNSGWAYTTRASADARVASRRLSPGGVFRQTARDIDKLLLLPFTEGELISRLYGFLDSYTRLSRRAEKAGRVVDWTRPDGVQEIIREASRVAFNYTSANRAYWQTGPLSIPTQFLQVPMKFYEDLLMPIIGGKRFKSQFTKAERFRMLMGQTILFGMAGVPLGNFIKDGVAKMLSEEGEYGAVYPEITDDQATAIAGGVVDWATSQIMEIVADQDVHPAISQRVALANGFDLLFSNLFGENPSMAKFMLGAVGGVWNQQVTPAIETVIRVHGTQIAAGTFTEADTWAILDKLATITKTWDNVHTARLWEVRKQILSASGEPILNIDPEEEDKMLIWLKKTGFATHEQYAATKIKDWNKDNNKDKEVKDALNAAQAILLDYLTDNRLDREEEAVRFSKELYFIANSLSSEEDKQEFAKQWTRLLQEDKTMASKEYLKYLQIKLEYPQAILTPPPIETAFVRERVYAEE